MKTDLTRLGQFKSTAVDLYNSTRSSNYILHRFTAVPGFTTLFYECYEFIGIQAIYSRNYA